MNTDPNPDQGNKIIMDLHRSISGSKTPQKILTHHLFFSNREDTVASTAPILCEYESLRSQFRWLSDGDLEAVIEERLESEIDLLEEYLRDLGEKDIQSSLKDGAEMGKTFYFESGDVFKWVSILRAADSLWSDHNEHGLIRLAEEGVRGSCPQIIARGWDRLVKTGITWRFCR